MKLYYQTFNLPFQYPFSISGGRTKTHQPTLAVALQLGNWYGVGEAPAINYYNISIEDMVQDIEKHKTRIEKFAFTQPDRYWHYLHHLIPNNPFLVSALDMAAWDLYGKMSKKNLYQIFNTNLNHIPTTNYTIGLDTVEKMIEKIKANPWPIYKIKLGTTNDMQIVQALRTNTNAVFRVDANAAWSLQEALDKIPQLKNLGVEFVEQPLHKDNWNDMKILYQQSCLPLIADESCVSEQDVLQCSQHFHGINIKLTKCSGITPALRMIEQAKKLNLKVMMGNMNESSIGSAAIANFLPQLDYVDLDGPLLLAQDLASGLSIQPTSISLQGNAGLGIQTTWLL